jgi:hypothetical protein
VVSVLQVIMVRVQTGMSDQAKACACVAASTHRLRSRINTD